MQLSKYATGSRSKTDFFRKNRNHPVKKILFYEAVIESILYLIQVNRLDVCYSACSLSMLNQNHTKKHMSADKWVFHIIYMDLRLHNWNFIEIRISTDWFLQHKLGKWQNKQKFHFWYSGSTIPWKLKLLQYLHVKPKPNMW